MGQVVDVRDGYTVPIRAYTIFIENMGNFKYEIIYVLEWKSKKGIYVSLFT